MLVWFINMIHTTVICAGDFWQAEDFFSTIPGVTHTAVGYAGGTFAKPTYHKKGDHHEAVQLEFNDRIIGYEEILMLLCEYAASYNVIENLVVFYLSDQELHRMQQWRELAEPYESNACEVEFLPHTSFYKAEDYHQHHLARLRGETIAKNHETATDLHK